MSAPILIDCDGVLSNMTRSVLALAAEHGVFRTPDDVTTWDYANCLGWRNVYAEIERATREREFVYRMHPYAGAFAFLRRLEAEHGRDNVLVCTSAFNADWAQQRLSWLADFAGVAKERVIITNRKDLVRGVLLDDAPHHVEGRDRAIVYDHPYNRDVSGARARDFAEAEALIRAAVGGWW